SHGAANPANSFGKNSSGKIKRDSARSGSERTGTESFTCWGSKFGGSRTSDLAKVERGGPEIAETARGAGHIREAWPRRRSAERSRAAQERSPCIQERLPQLQGAERSGDPTDAAAD